ncbi:YlaH-like family protein [Alkalicoccus chagannorensis]|uniref:YlaH-like family protein n=1 Tax=Alkalicoccus chagannorensis TaxID=427072 RepID=UPI0003FE3ADF|nr:YlaH-like family protein [Alkalicoccus chagannorensis]
MIFTVQPSPDTEFNVSPMAEFLGGADAENFLFVFFALFIIINLLSVIVFNLGFARKLPPLKNAIVYSVMFFGNFFLTFLALFMPIAESLVIAAVVLGVYKLQLRRHQAEEGQSD